MDPDSDSDDIYNTGEEVDGRREFKMEDVEDGEEEGEEVEDDSDVRNLLNFSMQELTVVQDEVNFITDAKEAPKQESSSFVLPICNRRNMAR